MAASSLRPLVIAFCLTAGFPLAARASTSANVKTIEMQVTDTGFEPKNVEAKPGDDVVLKITRKSDSTCSTQIQVPAKKIKMDLPLNKTVSLDLGRLEKGEIKFGCGMNMMDHGVISVK